MIGIIILSILLGICVLLLILFGRAILYQHQTILEVSKYLNEISFFNGDDIDEELVLNRYIGTLLISCQLAAKTGSIWDVSLYDKKKVIGLTILVPPQVIFDRLMLHIKKFMECSEKDLEEMITSLLEDIQNDIDIQPNTEVIELKDGTWLFRSVKKDEYND